MAMLFETDIGKILEEGLSMKRNQELVAELLAMRELGVSVSDGALNHARTDDLRQYESISITELASLFCELYDPMRPLN